MNALRAIAALFLASACSFQSGIIAEPAKQAVITIGAFTDSQSHGGDDFDLELPYTSTDPGQKVELACNVRNLLHLTVAKDCSCVNGVCKVALSPEIHYTGAASLDFTVNKKDDLPQWAAALLTLQFVDRAPVASDQLLSFDNFGSHPGTLQAQDPDNDPFTCAVAAAASHGTVSVNNDCTFSYSANASYVGADNFTFTASDGTKTSTQATVSIYVTAHVNAAPVANAKSVNNPMGQSYFGGGIDKLTGTDLEGASLTCAKASDPAHATVTVNADCTFLYTPNPTAPYAGTDTFTFTVNDGSLISAPATVTMNLTNTAPTLGAIGDVSGAVEISTYDFGIPVTDNETTQNMTVNVITSDPTAMPRSAVRVFSQGGSFYFHIQPAPGTNVTGSVTISVTDAGELTSNSRTFNVNVSGTSGGPYGMMCSSITTNIGSEAMVPEAATPAQAARASWMDQDNSFGGVDADQTCVAVTNIDEYNAIQDMIDVDPVDSFHYGTDAAGLVCVNPEVLRASTGWQSTASAATLTTYSRIPVDFCVPTSDGPSGAVIADAPADTFTFY